MTAAMGSQQPPSGSSALEEVKSVSTERLIPPKFSQPRRYFDETQMQQLVASVREFGIIQPLLVRPMGDKYEIVAGERRYRAALAVGLTAIPVIVRVLNDTEALECALMENLQRCDLNPVEETEGILRLLELSLGNSKPLSNNTQISRSLLLTNKL
ncbi:ParB/RepB/Spo0J family partition protein [[Phormidium] sp. ETS-05]|uniref:ParB/RepB/Spo0J family partition protein n=1 Tax=[Phormidium] sp. ETS-05 TaxID=222819 RepID=UPI0018EF191E